MRTVPLALLAVAAAALLAIWWMAGGDAAPPELPGGSRNAPTPAAGSSLTTPEDSTQQPERRATGVAMQSEPSRVSVGQVGWLGRVVDPDGSPIAGALVACTARAELDESEMLQLLGEGDLREAAERIRASTVRTETTSAADGRFKLVPPESQAPLRIEVRARGFQRLEHRATRPGDQDVDLGTWTLQPAGIVAGRVVDPSGTGIAGARVALRPGQTPAWLDNIGVDEIESLEPDRARTATTDASGHFELAHAQPGTWRLRATHRDHPPAGIDELVVEAGERVQDLVLVMQPGTTITGRVLRIPAGTTGLRVIARARAQGSFVDGPLGALLPDPEEMLDNLPFAMGSRTSAVADDGTFALDGLGTGERYRIWAVQNERSTVQMNPCTERVEVEAGTRGVELLYEAGVTVTFSVIDAETKAPVEVLGVLPKLSSGSNDLSALIQSQLGTNKARTYAGGRVSLTHLRPKSRQKLDLEITASGYAPFTRARIDLPQVGSLDMGTIPLQPVPVVQVRVTAAAGGEPVEGATVGLVPVEEQSPGSGGFNVSFTASAAVAAPITRPSSAAKHSAVTDANGICTVNSLPGSTVHITVHSDDHAPYRSEEIRLPDHANAEHRAALVAGGTVTVTVVDGDGEPVPNAMVTRTNAPDSTVSNTEVRDSRRTDGRGVARFAHLVPGGHVFGLGNEPEESGGVRTSVRVNDSEDEDEAGWSSAVVGEGGHVELTLVKPPTASLSGVVRENGVALARATVTFAQGEQGDMEEEIAERMTQQLGGGNRAKCDRDGFYEFDELPAGQHRLRIQHRDRAMPAIVAVTLHEGANTFDVDLTITELRGRVVDASGQPISRASVSVLENSHGESNEMAAAMGFMSAFGVGGSSSAKTDSDGTYELRGVRHGVPLVVTAESRDHAPARVNAEARDGATVELPDLVQAAAGRVRVRLQDGGLMNSVKAEYAGEEEGIAPVYAILRKGRATLEGLREGPWEIEVKAPGDTKRTEQVRVVAGETVSVDF